MPRGTPISDQDLFPGPSPQGSYAEPDDHAAASIDLYRFSSLRDVSHGISTRRGGLSMGPFASLNMSLSVGDSEATVRANRRRFSDSLGVPPESVVVGRLTHGNDVSVFRRDKPDTWPVVVQWAHEAAEQTDAMFPSDAVISDVAGLHFFLTSADCVPIAFVDRRRGVVGAAHAGWRGTALGIGGHVVRAMTQEFGTDPTDIQAAIGPSIGPCCYTVGSEVLRSFAANGTAASIIERRDDRVLDLWESNRLQLLQAGVPEDSIEVAGVCTSCRTDMFYSHRGEGGRTGRFAMCIGLP